MSQLLMLPTAASAPPATAPDEFWALYINLGDRTTVASYWIGWVAEPGEQAHLWVAYVPGSGITRKSLNRIVARWYGTPAEIVEVAL